jgi:hypothetical protein
MSDNCSSNVYTVGDHLCASAATCYFTHIQPGNLGTGERYDAKKLWGLNGLGVHPIKDDEGNLWNMGFSVMPTLKYHVLKIPAPGGAKGQDLTGILSHGKTVASISSRWSGGIAFNHRYTVVPKS